MVKNTATSLQLFQFYLESWPHSKYIVIKKSEYKKTAELQSKLIRIATTHYKSIFNRNPDMEEFHYSTITSDGHFCWHT